ncbi:MAG TPA: membrane protein insertion efficiency factor YidD [bacterium (Candidatus Stahlbacteria)]|nr:membrane protein insertion efficiency factor YidD [Candidatus Stahlbacteria bacterium]
MVRVLILLLRGYQALISPFLPPSCRFQPTCSAYAIEALKKYGAIKGLILSLGRIVRCNPFSRGGFEPLP